MAGRASERGFTLIEVMLSVSLLGMIAAITLPIFNSFLQRNDIDIAAQQVASSVRRAQAYSRAMNYDSAWSVEVQSSAITLFKGTVFGSRDTSYDEVVSLPGSITAGGLGEVQFSKFLAAPNTTGNITLTSNSGDTRTVTINAEGAVSY